MLYYLAIDLDTVIVKFEAVFESETEANRFADVMAELLVEFSFVQVVEPAFVPPF